jgi:ketosteroid isomerase-like protein
MSQENVELVLTLTPGADVDLAPMFRDDATWAAAIENATAVLDPRIEAVGTVIGTERPYVGLDGFREFMLDWIAPWASYRSEVEEVIDLGDQVLTLFRIFGQREGSAQEVESPAAWLWTIRGGKIARITGYADPREALKAVGLEE